MPSLPERRELKGTAGDPREDLHLPPSILAQRGLLMKCPVKILDVRERYHIHQMNAKTAKLANGPFEALTQLECHMDKWWVWRFPMEVKDAIFNLLRPKDLTALAELAFGQQSDCAFQYFTYKFWNNIYVDTPIYPLKDDGERGLVRNMASLSTIVIDTEYSDSSPEPGNKAIAIFNTLPPDQLQKIIFGKGSTLDDYTLGPFKCLMRMSHKKLQVLVIPPFMHGEGIDPETQQWIVKPPDWEKGEHENFHEFEWRIKKQREAQRGDQSLVVQPKRLIYPAMSRVGILLRRNIGDSDDPLHQELFIYPRALAESIPYIYREEVEKGRLSVFGMPGLEPPHLDTAFRAFPTTWPLRISQLRAYQTSLRYKSLTISFGYITLLKIHNCSNTTSFLSSLVTKPCSLKTFILSFEAKDKKGMVEILDAVRNYFSVFSDLAHVSIKFTVADDICLSDWDWQFDTLLRLHRGLESFSLLAGDEFTTTPKLLSDLRHACRNLQGISLALPDIGMAIVAGKISEGILKTIKDTCLELRTFEALDYVHIVVPPPKQTPTQTDLLKLTCELVTPVWDHIPQLQKLTIRYQGVGEESTTEDPTQFHFERPKRKGTTSRISTSMLKKDLECFGVVDDCDFEVEIEKRAGRQLKPLEQRQRDREPPTPTRKVDAGHGKLKKYFRSSDAHEAWVWPLDGLGTAAYVGPWSLG